ncbi:Uncharacterised protein [Mycobacterium tuberculosis]|nr:Uncharacterised protein [Mycobacterium tuberculosis]
MVSRSWASWVISCAKPLPSTPPKRLSAGTRAFSKNSSEVSAPCWPTLSRMRPRVNPASSAVSATISETPLAPALGSVLATTTIRSATDPLEMKVLAPLMR